jgi:hypothetical protein
MAESQRAASSIVKEFIESDGMIRNGLSKGLVNARALARYIQIATNDQYSFESIVSAIHRYPIKANSAKYETVGRFIEKLTMKNKMVHLAIQNDPGIPLVLARFSEKVNYGRGDTFHTISSNEMVDVVIDSKNLKGLLSVLPKANAINVEKDLTEILIVLSDEADRWVGTDAALTAQLAMNDVDIRFYLGGSLPGNVLVNVLVMEKDAIRAYQALESFAKQR